MRLRRTHECAKAQAVVLKHALILIRDAEGLQAALVFQLQRGLCCAVLHSAEDLDHEPWMLDNAAIAAHLLIGDVCVTVLALVLDLDELDVSDEAKHLDDVTDDLVRGDSFDQLDLVVCLEVGHLVLDLTDDFEVGAGEHKLGVDVDRGGDFAHGVLDEKDHAALQRRLQIDAAVMLDE